MTRPQDCSRAEDIYRWLLAEARWLVRIAWGENTFEHDSVQLQCDEGHPPPGQG